MVLVSHHAHVAVWSGQQQHEIVLRAIRVLVLVHHQVAVALANRVADRFASLQQADRFQQQVIKVQSVGGKQGAFVLLEDPV